jgi:hypothetical protein
LTLPLSPFFFSWFNQLLLEKHSIKTLYIILA